MMKAFLLASLGLGVLWLPQTKAATITPLTIAIEGLKSGNGGVSLTLFNEAQQKHYPVRPENAFHSEYKALGGLNKMVFVIPNLPEGEYAAFAYHDEDGNKKINTNLVGIPTEGYGASQGATNAFGPPKYADARFTLKSSVPNSQTVTVRVTY